MEKIPDSENLEEELKEKHSRWLVSARVMLESVGFGVATGVTAYLITYYAFKTMGVEMPMPPELAGAASAMNALNFSARRSKELGE